MALSGFLIVRVLDKPEYAAYTIAASLQALLSALTDCGIAAGLNAVGGRIWNDSARLRGLVAIALRLRTRLALIAIPMMVVSAFYLLRKNGVPWTGTIALTGGVLFTIVGAFLTAIYAVPLRLHALYTTVQKFDLLAAALRFALLVGLASFFLNALAAVLVSAVTLAFQGILLRNRTEKLLAAGAREDESDRQSLLRLVKKQSVATIFYAYQGQITIWIISIFGSTEKVADVGALSRLAILFALVASILTGLIAPTLARCETLSRLMKLFLVTLVTYLVFATALLVCSFRFPAELLWILGGKYESLTREVPWLVGNAIVGGLIAVVYTLASARGWIWYTWITPVLTIAAQVIAIPLLNLSTVRGVLVFGLVSLLPTLVVSLGLDVRGLWTSWKSGKLAPVAT